MVRLLAIVGVGLALAACARLVPGARDVGGREHASPLDARHDRGDRRGDLPTVSDLLSDRSQTTDGARSDHASDGPRGDTPSPVDKLAADRGPMLPPCPAAPLLAGWRPRLAWNGTQFGLLHHASVNNILQTHLALLAADLAKTSTAVDVQDDAAANSQDGHLVAGPAGAFGAVWTRVPQTPGTSLTFARLSTNGALGANLTVAGHWPAIAFNAASSTYAVVEADSLTPVSAGTGAAQPAVAIPAAGAPAAVWNAKSSELAIARSDTGGTTITLTRVSATLATATIYTPPAGAVVDANSGNAPVALAWNSDDNEYGVSFRLRPTQGGTIYTATLVFVQVSATGLPLKSVVVQPQGEYGLLVPALAWGGGRYAAAWTDSTLKAVRVVALDRAGAPLTPVENASCAGTTDHRYPSLAWSSTRFGLAWNQGGSSIYASWFRP